MKFTWSLFHLDKNYSSRYLVMLRRWNVSFIPEAKYQHCKGGFSASLFVIVFEVKGCCFHEPVRHHSRRLRSYTEDRGCRVRPAPKQPRDDVITRHVNSKVWSAKRFNGSDPYVSTQRLWSHFGAVKDGFFFIKTRDRENKSPNSYPIYFYPIK